MHDNNWKTVGGTRRTGVLDYLVNLVTRRISERNGEPVLGDSEAIETANHGCDGFFIRGSGGVQRYLLRLGDNGAVVATDIYVHYNRLRPAVEQPWEEQTTLFGK